MVAPYEEEVEMPTPYEEELIPCPLCKEPEERRCATWRGNDWCLSCDMDIFHGNFAPSKLEWLTCPCCKKERLKYRVETFGGFCSECDEKAYLATYDYLELYLRVTKPSKSTAKRRFRRYVTYDIITETSTSNWATKGIGRSLKLLVRAYGHLYRPHYS